MLRYERLISLSLEIISNDFFFFFFSNARDCMCAVVPRGCVCRSPLFASAFDARSLKTAPGQEIW